MSISHIATFNSRVAPWSCPTWGSFGGMKTCSITERRILGSISRSAIGRDISVERETVDVRVAEAGDLPRLPALSA